MFRVNILICKQLYKRCMHFGHNMNGNKGISCFSISEFRSATNVNEIIEMSHVYCNNQNFVHKLSILPSYGYRAVYILISLAGLIYAFYSQKYEKKKRKDVQKPRLFMFIFYCCCIEIFTIACYGTRSVNWWKLHNMFATPLNYHCYSR